MARNEPESQIVHLGPRHRYLFITTPVASDRSHLHTTAVHFPEQIIQAWDRRSRVARWCSRVEISAASCPQKLWRGADTPWHFYPEKGQSHPRVIVQVPHGDDELLIARRNPP